MATFGFNAGNHHKLENIQSNKVVKRHTSLVNIIDPASIQDFLL